MLTIYQNDDIFGCMNLVVLYVIVHQILEGSFLYYLTDTGAVVKVVCVSNEEREVTSAFCR